MNLFAMMIEVFLPEGHKKLIFSTRQMRENIFPEILIIAVVSQGDVAIIQGLISGLKSPDVNELILFADKDVKVSGAVAAEVEPGGFVVVEELAETLVSLEVLFDVLRLDVVRLDLHDLLLGGEALGVGRVLELDGFRMKEALEESGFVVLQSVIYNSNPH